jgi:hypothetical protein
MEPRTNETAMSRRDVLCASGAAALSALVAGVLPENLNLLKFLTFFPFARLLHDYGFAVL